MAKWRFSGKLRIERLANMHIVKALWAAFKEINATMKDVQSILLNKFKVGQTVINVCGRKPTTKSKRGGNPLFEFINARLGAASQLNPRMSLHETNMARADACEEYNRKVGDPIFYNAWLEIYRKRRHVKVKKHNTKAQVRQRRNVEKLEKLKTQCQEVWRRPFEPENTCTRDCHGIRLPLSVDHVRDACAQGLDRESIDDARSFYICNSDGKTLWRDTKRLACCRTKTCHICRKENSQWLRRTAIIQERINVFLYGIGRTSLDSCDVVVMLVGEGRSDATVDGTKVAEKVVGHNRSLVLFGMFSFCQHKPKVQILTLAEVDGIVGQVDEIPTPPFTLNVPFRATTLRHDNTRFKGTPRCSSNEVALYLACLADSWWIQRVEETPETILRWQVKGYLANKFPLLVNGNYPAIYYPRPWSTRPNH